MSHIVGTLQVLSPAQNIAPGLTKFPGDPAPGGTKFLMLHFNVDLRTGDSLTVNLGYGPDVFTKADGASFWTRPVNVYAFPAGAEITYVKSGAAGSVKLDKYGRGERHAEVPNPLFDSFSNCDPFYNTAKYLEPQYDQFWSCTDAKLWDNAACITPATDIRAQIAGGIGMIITQDKQQQADGTWIPTVSTCSVTLVDVDKIITAGHCHDPEETASSSVIFNYQTECDGSRPAGYSPRFYKVVEVIAHEHDGEVDYSLLRLKEPVAGVPIIQMRHDLPSNEDVFGIHHPNGAVKKVSPKVAVGYVKVSLPTPGTLRLRVPNTFHVSGGTSGSGLFDKAGRIVGVLSGGDHCGELTYYPTAEILKKLAAKTAPPPPITRDVMVVFDRSGSMSESDGAGRTKLDAAKDAASLFVQLVRAATGNKIGLISFSTAPSSPVDFPLVKVVNTPTPSTKEKLIGAPPFIGGKVGGLSAGGATSIGGGLDVARQQLPSGGANPRAVLLMTDGLQNSGLAPKDVDLTGINLHAIGFGSESSLDGNLLSALASKYGGLYFRAGGGLALEKFFAQAFGNIFEAGAIHDPEFELPANQPGNPLPFRICGEGAITLVAGWDNVDAELLLEVKTPGGATITASTAGVESSTGRTWTFLRIALPIGGERDGLWNVRVVRPPADGEFPAFSPAMRYFLHVIPTGGMRMSRTPDGRRYYTGDRINPRVLVRRDDGSWPDEMQVEMTITRPNAGPGNLLSAHGLVPATTLNGDVVPARQATLQAIEAGTGKPAVTYVDTAVTLKDTPSENGSFEPGGLFGHPMDDLLNMEGSYTFRARATYTTECVGMREIAWSMHIDVGIDPGKTTVTTAPPGPGSGGDTTLTFTPRDRYGNLLGPGRGDGFTVGPHGGSTPAGPVVDLGDGSYQVDVTYDPTTPEPPSIEIAQPERPPVVVAATDFRLFLYSVKFVCGEQKDDCCRCAPVVPGRYSTEINILNPGAKMAPVIKGFVPLVLAGAAVGREPGTSKAAAADVVKLEPHTATMDDCCRILEKLLGAPPAGPVPLTIGILEIISLSPLEVTAVYTASGPDGGAPSIDVERIEERLLVL